MTPDEEGCRVAEWHYRQGKGPDALAREISGAIRAQLADALDALEEYGHHTARCSWDTRGDAESVCDCGLHEALDKLRKAIG